MAVITMLLLHVVFQPYRSRPHNIIDAGLFANLLAINTLSTPADGDLRYFSDGIEKSILITSVIQIILIYIPLICLTLWVSIYAVRMIRNRCGSKSESLDEAMPYRLISYEEDGVLMDDLSISSRDPSKQTQGKQHSESTSFQAEEPCHPEIDAPVIDQSDEPSEIDTDAPVDSPVIDEPHTPLKHSEQ